METIEVHVNSHVLAMLKPNDLLRVVGRGPKDLKGGASLVLQILPKTESVS